MNKRKFSTYIIRIIDKETIMINFGTNDNEPFFANGIDEMEVKVGDKLQIIEPGPKIKDPITGESLGYYDSIKDILEITEMFPRFSICKKIDRVTITSGPLAAFGQLSKNEIKETVVPLNVNEEDIKPFQKDNNDKKIKVGDAVIFL